MKIQGREIQGIDELSMETIAGEVQKGARFAVFHYCISPVFHVLSGSSDYYFIKEGEKNPPVAVDYTFLTLFLGWWNIPHGVKRSLEVIKSNNLGGEDMTDEVINLLLEEYPGTDPTIFDPPRTGTDENSPPEEDSTILSRFIGVTGNVGSKDREGKTPLHKAAIQGHTRAVKLLLERGAAIDARDNDGWTPLHRAVFHQHYEIATVLLVKGADVNARDNSGKTALHRLAYRGNRKIAEQLILYGADTNAKDNGGFTPLTLARDKRQRDMVLFLEKEGARAESVGHAKEKSTAIDASDFYKAIEKNDIEGVKKCIKMGYDINARGLGATPLHRTAYNDHPLIAELLILNGADVNICDDSLETPLHWAAAEGSEKVADVLISNDAAVDIKNGMGETPLQKARKRGHHAVAELLLKAGAEEAGREP